MVDAGLIVGLIVYTEGINHTKAVRHRRLLQADEVPRQPRTSGRRTRRMRSGTHTISRLTMGPQILVAFGQGTERAWPLCLASGDASVMTNDCPLTGGTRKSASEDRDGRISAAAATGRLDR